MSSNALVFQQEFSELLQDLANLLTVDTLSRLEGITSESAANNTFADGVQAARAFIALFLTHCVLANLPEEHAPIGMAEALRKTLETGDATFLDPYSEVAEDMSSDAASALAAETVLPESPQEPLIWSTQIGSTVNGALYKIR